MYVKDTEKDSEFYTIHVCIIPILKCWHCVLGFKNIKG